MQNITKKAKDQVKKFVRYKEGAELYSMGRNKFMQMAKDAGACYKMDKVVLVNTQIFEAYLESFRVAGEW